MPHHAALALGTALAALGAKAASSGVDPSVFLSPVAAKGGGSLVALSTGKAAAAAAPAAVASFLSHGGGDATADLGNHAVSLLAAKGSSAGAIGTAGGKGIGTVFLAKGHGAAHATTGAALTKVGGGSLKASALKVGQKVVLAKKRGLMKAAKGVKGKKLGKMKKASKAKARKAKASKAKAKTKKAKAKIKNNNSSSSSGRQHFERHEGEVGGGGEGLHDAGGATAPPATALGPEGEAMPGSLSQASTSSGSGFLQVSQTGTNVPHVHAAPTHTATTVTTTTAPSGTPAATATTAATAATAAAAAKGTAVASPDHVAEGVGAVHQSAAEEGVSNAGTVYAPSPGADQARLPFEDSVEDDFESSSTGSGLLRSFARGALGSDEGLSDEGLLHGLSSQLGNHLLGGFGHRLTAAHAALTGGLGAGAAGIAMQGMDPSLVPSDFVGGGGLDPSALGDVDPENLDVEEEAMGVASLLPFLLSKLSLAATEGGGVREGKQQRGREERLSLHKDSALRRRSVASTACGSEGGCCSDASTGLASADGPPLKSPAARRVARSHAKGRRIVYRDFLC
ncbi:hypothetical protein Emag_004166 [Eimeria magna]